MGDASEELKDILNTYIEAARERCPDDKNAQFTHVNAAVRRHERWASIMEMLAMQKLNDHLRDYVPVTRRALEVAAFHETVPPPNLSNVKPITAPRAKRPIDQVGVAADADDLRIANQAAIKNLLTYPFLNGRTIQTARGTELVEHGTTMIAMGRKTAARGQFLVMVGQRCGERMVGDVLDHDALKSILKEATRNAERGAYAA